MEPTLKRRDFMAAALATGAAAAIPAVQVAAAEPAPAPTAARELYELRLYHMKRGTMTLRADDYFREALVPAARRHGAGPVGVFNVTIGPEAPAAYVLITHPSIESFATLSDKLAADADYRKAGDAFLSAPPTDPPYVGIQSWLLRAFEGMPKMEIPAATAKGEPRLFELRTYKSHSEAASTKKVEMFAAAGEIAIFRRVGVQPVFFSQGIVGDNLPSITYMVTFPDLATREKNFNAFRSDPDWKKLSTTPGYTDAELVTSIANTVLMPTTYSQI